MTPGAPPCPLTLEGLGAELALSPGGKLGLRAAPLFGAASLGLDAELMLIPDGIFGLGGVCFGVSVGTDSLLLESEFTEIPGGKFGLGAPFVA